jgi:hypothetical protein
MSDIYQVTLEQEVLHEMAASLGARYYHYIENCDIDSEDLDNPVVSYKWEIYAMKDSILDCKTLDELKVFSDRLIELRFTIERLEEECEKERLARYTKDQFIEAFKEIHEELTAGKRPVKSP